MSVVIINGKPSEEELNKALEEYKTYVKVTVDLNKKVVALGGEYHLEAQKILKEKYGSDPKDIWGGGYDVKSGQVETNAMINFRPEVNQSMEILDPNVRQTFTSLVKHVFAPPQQ